MIYNSGFSVPSSQYQDRWSPHPENRFSDVFTGKWTGKRPAVTHYQPTNRMIKSNDVENISRWYQSSAALCSLCSCVWAAGFPFHFLTVTVFIALQTRTSSYGSDLFYPAVCVIFLYKEQWGSALTVSSGRCGGGDVWQQIFANALFRFKIEAFRVVSTLLTCSTQLICHRILQLK